MKNDVGKKTVYSEPVKKIHATQTTEATNFVKKQIITLRLKILKTKYPVSLT